MSTPGHNHRGPHDGKPVNTPDSAKGEFGRAQHEGAPVNPTWTLHRDTHGRLLLTRADGSVVQGVVPVRAFPLSAPGEGLSLQGPDGREALWIEQLDALPDASRALIDESLATLEFAPQIRQLRAVSTFSTPSTWEVDTDRGPASFVLKGEEDIRRLEDGTLLVTDSFGVGWRMRPPRELDRRSRRLLERFL
jgi:hypothetical protein